jgi:hypothetical protein
MRSQTVIGPETCFERTRAGQCEMLSQRETLSPIERRLLAIVNGYTPLGDLLALLGEAEVPQDTITKLLDAGCLRPVTPKPRKVNLSGVDFRSANIEWFGAN